MRRLDRTAAWAAALVALGGGIWLLHTLTANYPGDAGPVVGPGAAEKVRYGFVAGAIIVACAAAIGVAVWLVRTVFTRYRAK